MSSPLPTALARYKEVAQYLSDSPEIAAIVRGINEMGESLGVMEFMFLQGSSGMGKTQAALTVREIMFRQGKPVFYMVAEPIKDHSQAIYKVFSGISELFLASVSADASYLGDSLTGFNNWNSTKLFTYGFINAIFRRHQNQSEVITAITPCLISQVYDGVDKALYSTSVIILDELNAQLKPELARFKRNVFRSLHLKLVTLGTDARIMNLILGNSLSRNAASSEVAPWCRVIYRLPKVDLRLLSFQSVPPPNILTWILAHSRPLFSKLAHEYYVNNVEQVRHMSVIDLLDQLIGHVAREVATQKQIFESPVRRVAQLCLFGNTSYSTGFESAFEGSRCINPTVFIHDHFANLYVSPEMDPDESGVFQLMADQTVQSKQFRNPKSSFPSPSDDILLYLGLLGGRHFSPVQSIDREDSSVHDFVSSVITALSYENRISVSNINQVSNSGMQWEFFCTACMCVASRSNGLAGSRLREFLPSLLYHLTGRRITSSPLLETISHLADWFVPFLCAPNQIWPPALATDGALPGSRLGHIRRERNADKIDIAVESVSLDPTLMCVPISGECKDYQAHVPWSDVNKAILNIPLNSKLHLFFANSFNLARKAKIAKTASSGMSVVSYLCDLQGPTNELVVECISHKGGVDGDPQCVVLLLPFGRWNPFHSS